MLALVGHIGRSIAQISDPRFLAVLFKAGVLAILMLALMAGLAWYAIGAIPDMSFTLFGYEIAFLDEFVRTVAGSLALGALLFAALPTAGLVIGFFLEEIAEIVERRHYPALPPARRQSVLELTGTAGIFMLTLLTVNLLALPIYLLSTVLAPILFWLVNGYLIGREYFEIVAHRRMTPIEASVLRRRHMGRVWLCGALGALAMTLPFLNLIAAPLAVACFTHLFHDLRGRRAGEGVSTPHGAA